MAMNDQDLAMLRDIAQAMAIRDARELDPPELGPDDTFDRHAVQPDYAELVQTLGREPTAEENAFVIDTWHEVYWTYWHARTLHQAVWSQARRLTDQVPQPANQPTYTHCLITFGHLSGDSSLTFLQYDRDSATMRAIAKWSEFCPPECDEDL